MENNEQLKLFLAEAIEMLEDVKHKFGMFEHQYYQRFKSSLDDFNELSRAPQLEEPLVNNKKDDR